MLTSIIILNWNDGVENCFAAIRSALQQDYENKEIIFVDNGSTDNSLQAVKQEFPFLKFIESKINLGCPGGRNIGVSSAQGELIFFLETDAVWASSDVVSGVVSIFNKYPKIGALYIRVDGYLSGKTDPPLDKAISKTTQNGLYLSSSFRGGASAIRKKLFNTIGQFPADFFRQYEERYVSLLIYQNGFKVAYWPERVLLHKGSDYLGKSESVVKYNCINELKTILRIYPKNVYFFYFISKSLLWIIRLVRTKNIKLLYTIFISLDLRFKINVKRDRISLNTLKYVNFIRSEKTSSPLRIE